MTTFPTRDLPTFLAAALWQQGATGAVAPSSRGLARSLSAIVPTSGHPTVVELGPGTGAVSKVISSRLPCGSRHLAVEVNPSLADHLRRTQPEVTVLEGDAAELGALLDAAAAPAVDAVVSGLPWSLFDERRQRGILSQVSGALAVGAGFSTFAYRHAVSLAAARRFRSLLHGHFDEVVVTRTVWRNLPPALVYVCRRPVVPHKPASVPASSRDPLVGG